MQFIIAPLLLASVALAAEMGMNMAGPSNYNFGYNTGEGHSRSESGSGGNVAGHYQYTDANGDLRTVHYTAGPEGFKASGDIGVDRRTAAAAEALNAMAPKAAVPAAPVHSWAAAPAPHYYGAPAYYGPVAPIHTNFYPGLTGYNARW